MKLSKFLKFIERHQPFAYGWLIATLVFPTCLTRIIGFIFVLLLIANDFSKLPKMKGGIKK